jgi:NitT/TauT family transport system substrate-binding protein
MSRITQAGTRALLSAVVASAFAFSACATDGKAGASSEDGTVVVQVASESFGMLSQLMLFAGDYLEEEGLEIEYLPANPNAAQVAQSVTSSADIAFPGSTGVLPAVAAGRDVVSIATITQGPTTQLAVRKDAIEKTGVTADAPLEERIQALKGLTLGLPAAGTVTDILVRDLLSRNGVTPEKDVTIRPIADVTALLTAMREGAVDAIAFSPPTSVQGVQEGYAEIWASLGSGEIPEFEPMPFVDVVTSQAFLDQRGEDVEKFLRALDAASKALSEDPEAAAKIIKERWLPDLDQEVFDLSFEYSLPSSQRGLVPTQEGFEILLQTVNATSDEEIDVSFEDVYDTELISKITEE